MIALILTDMPAHRAELLTVIEEAEKELVLMQGWVRIGLEACATIRQTENPERLDEAMRKLTGMQQYLRGMVQ